MKIAVCVKQVPKGDALIDSKTGLLIRKELKTNLYDTFPIETALQIKDKIGATIDVFSLSPLKAQENFKEYYALGVDHCYLISDNAFRGADVFATSYAIKNAISATNDYDLIITGRQTEDGDTSSVGASIAEEFNIPSIMYVKKVVNITEDSITLERELTSSIETVRSTLPCLIAVDKDTVVCRIPTLMNKLKASKKNVDIITLSNLKDQDITHYGEKGSKTKVTKIYEETPLSKGVAIDGSTDEKAKFITQKVKEIK